MNNKFEQETMLGKLDRVMRQLRRRPEGNRHGGRGTYRLLRLILENPGLTTRQLAARMDIRPSSLNEKLVSLEGEGMIRRQRDPRDQRVYLVHLEAAGIEHLEEARRDRLNMNEAIGEILTAQEIEELSRLADKLAQGLERQKSQAAPDPAGSGAGPVKAGTMDGK